MENDLLLMREALDKRVGICCGQIGAELLAFGLSSSSVDRHVDNFGRKNPTPYVFLKFFYCLKFVQIVSYAHSLWMTCFAFRAEALIDKAGCA